MPTDDEEERHKQAYDNSAGALGLKAMDPKISEDAGMVKPIVQVRMEACKNANDSNTAGLLEDSNSMMQLRSPSLSERPSPQDSDRGEARVSKDCDKGESPSNRHTERPDILWCLNLYEDGKTVRSFYKDQPWKGINNGLPGSDPDRDDEREAATMVFEVGADVKDRTNKLGNTLLTWRDEPVDFQFGKDAYLITRHWPIIQLYSGKLIKVMELLLDYYPDHMGDFDIYDSRNDNFDEFMYYYPELKAYFNTYIRRLPEDLPLDPKLEIGSCGDEEIAKAIQEHLDFGALNMEMEPCDEDTAYDLAALLRLLAPIYRMRVVPTMTSRLLSPEPLVKYETLYLFMRPGTLVYVQQSVFKANRQSDSHREDDWFGEDKERSAWIVSSWSYQTKNSTSSDDYQDIDRLVILLWSIQYDGKFFQRGVRVATMPRFEGSRAIKTLQIIPWDIQDRFDGGELRRRLEKRGQKFLSILREPAAHREYENPRSGYNGQIIIDPEAYMQYSTSPYDETLHPYPIVDGGGGKKFRGLTDFTASNSENFSRVNEVYVLLPRRIEGFGLKTKRWMVFEIDNISEKAPVPSLNQLENELVLISDADKESLRTVLPKGEKPVGVCSDFVQGKGEGKIFLLYGPPGTGKTLTVECVANDTGRPLLSLTAQDVGLTTSTNAEMNLRQWFTLAAKWDAILLIDEADLFLEQRREGSLERNSLSTVFLRTMEYYEGVLFLTTNRAGHIDDSFISRITCPIAYHPLSQETKSKIIRKFVRKFEETGTIEIQQRAETYVIEHCTDLNGRQIRNVLQNAVAIAEVQQRSERNSTHKSSPAEQQLQGAEALSVKWHHVKAAVERQTEFRLYLNSLKGKDENARARSKQDYLSTAPTSRGRED